MMLTLLQKDVDDTSPLLPQEVGSREGSISSADNEAVDSLLDEGSELSSLLGSD
jgi:hypothetical protein